MLEKRSTKFWVLAGLLFVAACVTFGMAFVVSLGAALCEGQGPGECEAKQDDADIWLWFTLGLVIAAVMSIVRGVIVRRRDYDEAK